MRRIALALVLAATVGFVAPRSGAVGGEKATILVAAAASLQYSYVDELIPLFQKKYPWISVEGTYDSSGKLQTQIENGLDADVFMSAAMRQMNTLVEKKFVRAEDVVRLVENKIVLIRPADRATPVTGFESVLEAGMIAVGDPASVPAGQYAKEAFTSLGLWDEVEKKASLGTNVTEVLNWVVEGSADVGVVYATDAATTPRVAVVAAAPAGSLKQPVIYPVAVLAAAPHPEEAKLFVDFLRSGEALAVFEKYGFAPLR